MSSEPESYSAHTLFENKIDEVTKLYQLVSLAQEQHQATQNQTEAPQAA